MIVDERVATFESTVANKDTIVIGHNSEIFKLDSTAPIIESKGDVEEDGLAPTDALDAGK